MFNFSFQHDLLPKKSFLVSNVRDNKMQHKSQPKKSTLWKVISKTTIIYHIDEHFTYITLYYPELTDKVKHQIPFTSRSYH